MRRKVSTLLDDRLYRRAKLESALRGKQISEIIGEALERYLEEHGSRGAATGVVDGSFGVMKLEPTKLQKVMEEEDWLEAR